MRLHIIYAVNIGQAVVKVYAGPFIFYRFYAGFR